MLFVDAVLLEDMELDVEPSDPFLDSIERDCLRAMEIILPQQKMSTTKGAQNPRMIKVIVNDKEYFIFSPQIGMASAWNLYSPQPITGELANSTQNTHRANTTTNFLFVVTLIGYRIGSEMMKNLSNDNADSE